MLRSVYLSVWEVCLNRNLKVSGFLRVFEDVNGEFIYKILIINILIKYSDFLENCVRHVFLSVFEEFYILLIINYLSLSKKFQLFVLGKKPPEMLNLHFGRKYHFVKSKNNFSACFLLFLSGCIRSNKKDLFF